MTSGPGADAPEPAAALPATPAAAHAIFGGRVEVAEGFVALLADTGVSHGLLGPREVPRLWERHVLNCAVAVEALPKVGASVIDVGSGAGLPGIALAITRTDLRVTLVEPLLRRTTWLDTTIAALGLDNVEVRRGRAEDFAGTLTADYVVSRAVASLDKLARWCAPLVGVGGELVALKGSSAADELASAATVFDKLGLGAGRVESVGTDLLAEPTLVVIAPKVREVGPRPPKRKRAGSKAARRT